MGRTGRHVVLYLPLLAAGGAERVCLNLAPALMRAGYRVTLLLQRLDGPLVSAIPPELRVVSLKCSRSLLSVTPLVRFLRQERPDFLISGLGYDNLIALLASFLAGVSTRIIVSQHNFLSKDYGSENKWHHHLIPFFYRLFLNRADSIVAVSKGVADDLAAVAKIRRERITVIYNPIVPGDFESRVAAPVNDPWFEHGQPPVILAAGRLVEQKNFAMLISAFARVAEQKPLVHLLILGEGPLRAQLEAHAKTSGIADRVRLIGFRPNPLPFMRRAAVLVMSSRYEGFGNVLVEALACGTPVVSTDCQSGPGEILDNGRYGRLVPVNDSGAMAQAILDTLEQPLPRETLMARGQQFTVARAVKLYIQLFESMS